MARVVETAAAGQRRDCWFRGTQLSGLPGVNGGGFVFVWSSSVHLSRPKSIFVLLTFRTPFAVLELSALTALRTV